MPHQATFGPGCSIVVAYVPLLFSLLVFFCRYALAPLWHRRPAWLHDFATEEADVKVETFSAAENGNGVADHPPLSAKAWNWANMTLFGVSAAGAVSSTVMVVAYRGQHEVAYDAQDGHQHDVQVSNSRLIGHPGKEDGQKDTSSGARAEKPRRDDGFTVRHEFIHHGSDK